MAEAITNEAFFVVHVGIVLHKKPLKVSGGVVYGSSFALVPVTGC